MGCLGHLLRARAFGGLIGVESADGHAPSCYTGAVLVVACLDLSPSTPSVFEAAAMLAQATSATLVVLHVAAPEPDFIGYDVGPQSVRNAVAHEIRSEHRALETWRTQAAERGLAVRALIVQGPTVERILDHAERLGADYIVVGSHGHATLRHLIHGSVAKGVLQRATKPVLLVPCGPPGQASLDDA